MNATAVILDSPEVPTPWTMTHEAYDARFERKGLASGCAGTFVVTENDGKRPAVATCDRCAMHVGILQAVLREPPPAQPTSAMPF